MQPQIDAPRQRTRASESGGAHVAEAGARPVSAFRLSAEESAQFLRVVSLGALISRHDGIHKWLGGEVQRVLPHQILIAAWGDFARRQVALDIVSAIPGLRAAPGSPCDIDDFVQRLHADWVRAGRSPILIATTDSVALRACACLLHSALRGMRSAVVHGVRDRRSGSESLYIALDSEPIGAVWRTEGFKFLVDCLIAQIDVAFRRAAQCDAPSAAGAHGMWRELSRREQEILAWVCRGESNMDIAATLGISPHTVKNHLQRIFRKIGVNNRTQAAAQYNDALRAAGEHG